MLKIRLHKIYSVCSIFHKKPFVLNNSSKHYVYLPDAVFSVLFLWKDQSWMPGDRWIVEEENISIKEVESEYYSLH